MIEINNESAIDVDETVLQRLTDFNLAQLHVSADAEVAIVLVDEGAMEALHVQWMDEPGPTDVLSFPMDELRPGTEDRPTPPGCSATSSSARRSRRRRRRPPATRSWTSSSCSPRTDCCTFSASITRSRMRSGDVRSAEAAHPGLRRVRASPAMTELLLLVAAVLLVAFGGLMAAIDAAYGVTSRAGLADMATEGRRAKALERIAADLDAHVNAVAFIRVLAEVTAAVLVTVAFTIVFENIWWAMLAAAILMTGITFVLVGASPRTFGHQHAESMIRGVRTSSGDCASFSGRSPRASSSWATASPRGPDAARSRARTSC